MLTLIELVDYFGIDCGGIAEVSPIRRTGIQITKAMNMKVDLKSALCGIVVGVLAMLVIAAADSSANVVGKYQAAGGAGFFLILDTASGKAWFANVSANNLTHIDKGFFEAKLDK